MGADSGCLLCRDGRLHHRTREIHVQHGQQRLRPGRGLPGHSVLPDGLLPLPGCLGPPFAIVLSTVATRAVLHTYNQTLRRVVHEEAFSEPAMVSEPLRSMFSIDSFERVDSHPLMRIKFSQKVSFDKRGSMDRAG